MPRKHPTLWERIRIAFIWVLKLKNSILTMSCGCCGSIFIQRKSFSEDGVGSAEAKSTYMAVYECQVCKAIGRGFEEWMRENHET